MPTAVVTALSRQATTAMASTRGTTSRWITEMPSTSSASSSSRILREPRSAATAVPAAPATITTVAMGAACWTMPTTATAPVKERAPSWLNSEPIWSASTAPNGTVIAQAGSRETRVTNQAWSKNSRTWNGRRNRPARTSSAKVNRVPTGTSGRARAPGFAAAMVLPG